MIKKEKHARQQMDKTKDNAEMKPSRILQKYNSEDTRTP
jgi:hypothetical protein